jgi:hypothetical protein
MQVNKSDKVNCENMIKLLRRAKIELQGAEEILGTAEVLRWMSGLLVRVDTDLKEQAVAAVAVTAIATAKPVATMTKVRNKRA